MNNLKIAIDNGALSSGHSVRGVGTYTRELIGALGEKIEAVDFRNTNLSSYDIIHYPYFSLFQHTLPLSKPTKTVVTIHDVIPLIYPSHYPAGIKGEINFYFQKQAVKKADAIITDTETSKKDIVRFLGVNPKKVRVVYLAPRKIFKKITDKDLLKKVKEKYDLPKNFILYVGDVNYNKNIPNLIKAANESGLPLVMVGKQAKEIDSEANKMKSISGPFDFLRFLMGKSHPELAHYSEILKNISENSNVYRLGYVDDSDLVAIYNLAKVYVQPSFYEGFGLPALEAISCGTPVASAHTQALVEILGGGGNYFDPKDINNMASVIQSTQKNGKLPREYSWEKTAKETFEVYESI